MYASGTRAGGGRCQWPACLITALNHSPSAARGWRFIPTVPSDPFAFVISMTPTTACHHLLMLAHMFLYITDAHNSHTKSK
ncbi:hypothetical protein HaLaN_31326 [Haematococcus lacustris]|uniref:Uncharacterized protein n=1 Tax=Haematococcus lacustris TaxID=44745 RepID=A0A6A0AJC2_HAELA|nr:hypothetical protein HaLaN_31326 [Haematococcus lacustris]